LQTYLKGSFDNGRYSIFAAWLLQVIFWLGLLSAGILCEIADATYVLPLNSFVAKVAQQRVIY